MRTSRIICQTLAVVLTTAVCPGVIHAVEPNSTQGRVPLTVDR